MLPFGIGFGEIILIAIVLLLVVGPHKLPDLAKTVGKGLRVVRKAGNELRDAMQIDEVSELRRDIRREMYKPVNDWKDGIAEVEDAVVEPFQRPKTISPDAAAAAALNADTPKSDQAEPEGDVEDAEVESSEVETSGMRARMKAAAAQAEADAAADHAVQVEPEPAVAEAAPPSDDLPDDDAEWDDDDDDHDGAGPTSIARHDPLLERLRAENARLHSDSDDDEGAS